MHRAILFPLLAFALVGCSGSDFGVPNGDDGGTDATSQDSYAIDAPLDANDAHADGATDTADAPPKCAAGALYRMTGPFTVGGAPGAVAAGDLNHDGHLDLVVAKDAGQVTVLVGAGDGTFSDHHDFTTGAKPLDVDLADVNGDGAIDVVVTSLGAKDVELLTGIGDGYLHDKTTIATLASPTASALAKLDADDLIDLAIVDASTGTLEIRKGNGDGTFAATGVGVAVGLSPLAVSAVTLGTTSTAPIDLVVAVTNGDALAVVAGPSHTTAAPVVTGVVAPWAIAFGDFDVDGFTDIAAADHTDGTAMYVTADGSGGFTKPKSAPATANAQAIVSADLDGDGHVDLFVGSPTDLVFLKGQIGAAFAAPKSLTAPGAGLATGDFDGDTHLDVAASDPSGSVRLFLSCVH